MAAALISACSAFGANLVTDASFESGLTSEGDASYPADRPGPGATPPHTAAHRAGRSQVLKTVAGQTYKLSFWYANRAHPDGVTPTFGANGLQVDVGSGAITVSALPSDKEGPGQWTLYTATFAATGPTRLTFATSDESDTWATSLEDVRVTPISEPAPLAMMFAGLLVLLGLARRRLRVL